MTTDKGRRLGRGLEALIPMGPGNKDPRGQVANELQRIQISQIRPNPYQPRREFNADELAELEASIRASGLLQPIAVRRIPGVDAETPDSTTPVRYELISGERRLRAVTRLGWTEVPALVKEIDDRTLLTLAMIENLQRSDLNPVEEAMGYRTLIDEFGLTQQQVAEAIGKDRTTVAGLLRILNLPPRVLDMVAKGELSAGHARALLALQSPDEILALSIETASRQLSVREVEHRVRDAARRPPSKAAKTAAPAAPSSAPTATDTAAAKAIEDQLRRHFQTDVRLSLTGPAQGSVELRFYSADDLDRLVELILGRERTEPYPVS